MYTGHQISKEDIMEDKGLTKYDENNPFEIIVCDHMFRLPRIFLVGIYDSYQLIDCKSEHDDA